VRFPVGNGFRGGGANGRGRQTRRLPRWGKGSGVESITPMRAAASDWHTDTSLDVSSLWMCLGRFAILAAITARWIDDGADQAAGLPTGWPASWVAPPDPAPRRTALQPRRRIAPSDGTSIPWDRSTRGPCERAVPNPGAVDPRAGGALDLQVPHPWLAPPVGGCIVGSYTWGLGAGGLGPCVSAVHHNGACGSERGGR